MRFGAVSVTIAPSWDTSDTRLGTEWPQVLCDAVENSRVLISVIGPDWILARDEYGRRRIDDPEDWVRREIELALEHGKTIMPLLVRRARMIPASALPREIASLALRQAFEIRAESWAHDLEFVLRELASHLGQSDTSASLPRSIIDAPGPAFTADDFRAVVLGFDSSSVKVRHNTAEAVKDIAAFLELEDVLGFCRSRKTAERVGGSIALGVHLRSSKETRRPASWCPAESGRYEAGRPHGSARAAPPGLAVDSA